MTLTRFSRALTAALPLALVWAATIALTGQSATATWTTVAPGVEHAHVVRPAPGGVGAWNVHALRVDMTRARLDVMRANDDAIALDTVSAIAGRANAIAAINGGYFRMSGDYRGDPTGTLQVDGAVFSEPDRERAAVGIVRDADGARLIFGHVAWRAELEAGGDIMKVDGVNRARGPDDLVVFTPPFDATTRTDASGIEATVREGRVVEIHDMAGGRAIPRDGFVVSARGRAREWVKRALTPDTRVTFSAGLRPARETAPGRWAEAEDVLGAGPKLVTAGRVDVTDRQEQMTPSFATDLHPRSAIAALADGRALLVVVDGRRPPERVGLSLEDLARLLIDLGAVEAINLDGGGSTAMVVQGKVVNYPSDPTGERPVSDAIVVRPKP